MMGGLLPAPEAVPRKPSRRPYLLAAIAGPLLLALLVVQIGSRFAGITVLRQLNQDAYEQRIVAAELMSSFAQAEAAQRGYVITGRADFLSAYDAARARVADDLAGLTAFDVADHPVRDRIVRLRALIDARLREMALVVGLRQRGGLSVAAARITAGRSLALTQSAHAIARELTEIEAATIGDRIVRMRRNYIGFERLLWSVTLLLAALLFTGLWMLWRSRVWRFELERDAHDTALRLSAMFARNSDATLLLDPQGRIEAANGAAKRLLGYRGEDLTGRSVVTLFDVEDQREFHDRIGLVDGQLTKPYWLDRTIRHADGRAVPVDIALGLLEQPDGLRVLMMMRDIGERKTVERLKDEFLATVSHELRTPLTSVIGALGLLRNGSAGRLSDPAERLVEIAENNAQRLIRLVNDLLDIERIGTGRMHFERARIDLGAVVQSAVDAAHGIADARGVKLELRAPGRPPLIVQGDRDRLAQVLANLLSNAVRFSPDDGTVRVSLESRDGQACLTVDDEGPGIPADFSGRIFERFAQASGTPAGGSGLGLAISREIVVAHEGRISFGRAPGPRGGARFTVALPLAAPETPRPAHRARVLVGEADAEAAQRLRAMLEADACAVDIVATDDDLLAAARSGRYDALLVDVALPADGGLEALRTLRQRPDMRTLPAILISSEALAGGEETRAALDLVDWIEKPIDSARLVAAVRRAIDHSARIRPTLLHIDDDVDMLEVAAVALAGHGRVVHATSIASARALLAVQAPDVVILDLALPDGSGCDLLPELVRADGSAIPTIIYSALDVVPELEHRVDAVLVKSRRSLDSLARSIHRILAHHREHDTISA